MWGWWGSRGFFRPWGRQGHRRRRPPAACPGRPHEAGVRGARLPFLPYLGPAPTAEAIAAVTGLVRPYGRHLAPHVTGDGLADHEDPIRPLPPRLVIDHRGQADRLRRSRRAPHPPPPNASSGAPTTPTANTHGFVPDDGDLTDLAPDEAARHVHRPVPAPRRALIYLVREGCRSIRRR
ncbi:hypothetical protein [Streptomyces acidiscabies]|uniref:hypothetical protein n=1 Tax=Streptomyces acidiscabies TaxID=42234 RepID=UPI0038F6BAEB